MKKKQILVLSLLIVSFFIIPTVYSKKEDPLNELWEAVNDLIFRVTVLEETGTPDISELETRIESLETRLEILENTPPQITWNAKTGGSAGIEYYFEWTVIDQDGHDFIGEITGLDPDPIMFSQDSGPTYSTTAVLTNVGDNIITISVTEEHGVVTQYSTTFWVIENELPYTFVHDYDDCIVNEHYNWFFDIYNEPGEEWTGTIDFGDGTIEHISGATIDLDDYVTILVEHVYTETGEYFILIILEDSYNEGENAAGGYMTVDSPPP